MCSRVYINCYVYTLMINYINYIVCVCIWKVYALSYLLHVRTVNNIMLY